MTDKQWYDPDLIWCDECDCAVWVRGDSESSDTQICPDCLEANKRVRPRECICCGRTIWIDETPVTQPEILLCAACKITKQAIARHKQRKEEKKDD